VHFRIQKDKDLDDSSFQQAVTVFGKWQPLVLSVLNGAMITSSMLFSVLKV